MADAAGYTLTITRDGPPSAPYGWQIHEQAVGPATKSSVTTFQTQIEALTDSTRAAVELAINALQGVAHLIV
jgi:hypothetical protein